MFVTFLLFPVSTVTVALVSEVAQPKKRQHSWTAVAGSRGEAVSRAAGSGRRGGGRMFRQPRVHGVGWGPSVALGTVVSAAGGVQGPQ